MRSRTLEGIEKGGHVMFGCAGRKAGANLSKRVFESNSRIASLSFGKNYRDTRRSGRRQTA